MGNQYRHRRRRPLWGLPAVVVALSGWNAAAAQGVDVARYKERVLALINEQRAAYGLPALRRVASLDAAAQGYSDTMMRATAGGPVYLSHTGPDGSTLDRRITAAGYVWFHIGENLAAGEKTPEQVVADWLSSPLHRENILSPSFRDIGLGLAVGPGTWSGGWWDPQVRWWTADFAEGTLSGPVGTDLPSSRPQPPPTVTGYAAIDGSPVSGGQFGSLVLITGRNLGFNGTVSFHGQPTSAVAWSPLSIMALVPLQPSYPDVGPVRVTVAGQSADGPQFMTVPPGALPSTPSLAPAPTGGPTITGLEDLDQQSISSVPLGLLFTIRGRAFGANRSGRGRVVFLAAGKESDGAVWDWADDAITVFAPISRGLVEIVVQVDVNGSMVTTNRWPLTIQ